LGALPVYNHEGRHREAAQIPAVEVAMNPYVAEQLAFGRLTDIRRDVENSRVLASSVAALATRAIGLLERRVSRMKPRGVEYQVESIG
jgi:hypothetical protein